MARSKEQDAAYYARVDAELDRWGYSQADLAPGWVVAIATVVMLGFVVLLGWGCIEFVAWVKS